MSTATTVAGQQDAQKAAKAPRSYSVTLHGGNGTTLRIMALRKQVGASTIVINSTKAANASAPTCAG